MDNNQVPGGASNPQKYHESMLHPDVSSFIESQNIYQHSQHEMLAFSDKTAYQFIEDDQTPHTAYYNPQSNGMSRGHKKQKRAVFTDRKQMAPVVNKHYKDGSDMHAPIEPERYYQETMQMAKAHLEDTATTMQRLRESQSGAYPKTEGGPRLTEGTRKSLEFSQGALSFNNQGSAVNGLGKWTPGGTQQLFLQQFNSTNDQSSFMRERNSEVAPQMPSFPGKIHFDTQRKTHHQSRPGSKFTDNQIKNSGVATQRTVPVTQASSTQFYRTPLTTAGGKKHSPRDKGKMPIIQSTFIDSPGKNESTNSRGASPLQQYNNTYHMFDGHTLHDIQEGPQQRNLLSISKHGMQFRKRQHQQSIAPLYNNMQGHINQAKQSLNLPVRHKRGQPQPLYAPTYEAMNAAQKLNDSLQSAASLENVNGYNHSLRQHLHAQHKQSSNQLSASKRSIQNSRTKYLPSQEYPLSAQKTGFSKVPTSATSSNWKPHQSPKETRFGSNTNMKYFSSQQSKLGITNSIKKNPSWQQLKDQDLLNNRHSKGTLATAQALNNLLAIQRPKEKKLSQMTTITKRQHQKQSNKSSHQSLPACEVKPHSMRVNGLRNSLDLKTSPTTAEESKLNADRLYPRKATQVALRNIIPAPPLNTVVPQIEQVSSKLIVKNTDASRIIESKAGAAFKKQAQVKKKHIQLTKLQQPQVDRIKKLQRAYLAPSLIPDEHFERQRLIQIKHDRGLNDSSILRISRQDAVKSVGSMRLARSAYGQHRTKSKNSKGDVRKSQVTQKSMGEGSLERAMNELSLDRSSCHCSQDKRRIDTLHDDSRNHPTNVLKSGDSFSNSRLPTNRHIGHGCQDSYSRHSQESSLTRFKQLTPSKRRIPEEKLGVIKCPRCEKRLKQVVGRRRHNELSDTQAFESNMFKDVLKHIPRRNSVQQSTHSLMHKGLNYKFSLKDLPKYSARLNSKDIDKRFSRSAMAKRVPTLTDRVKKMEQRQRGMKDRNKWDTLRNQCILQQSDWAKSNLYQQFLRHGRSLTKNNSPGEIAVDSIYTETELRYYIELLRKLANNETDKDQQRQLESHSIKAQSTLKWLMKLIGFDYYFERILFRYQKQEQEHIAKNLQSPQTIHTVIKVMVRSLQMYETIEAILLIFSLLQKLEGVQDRQMERHLGIRVIAVVKQLTLNNKFMQRQFVFRGRDVRREIEKKVNDNKA